jgi:hypothetical protein
MSTTETPEPVSTDVTYIGRRTLASNGKLGYAYLEGERTRYYTAPLVTGAQIGARITITSPADEPDVYFSRPAPTPHRRTRHRRRRATLTAWQVADRAAYQLKADADASKRAAKQAAHLERHIEALTYAARPSPGAASGVRAIRRRPDPGVVTMSRGNWPEEEFYLDLQECLENASTFYIPTPELERAIADLADRGWTRLPQRAGGDGGRR